MHEMVCATKRRCGRRREVGGLRGAAAVAAMSPCGPTLLTHRRNGAAAAHLHSNSAARVCTPSLLRQGFALTFCYCVWQGRFTRAHEASCRAPNPGRVFASSSVELGGKKRSIHTQPRIEILMLLPLLSSMSAS